MPIVNPHTFRAAWRSCQSYVNAHKHRSPTRRNARWLLARMVDAAEEPAGPFMPQAPPGVGRLEWEEFLTAAV